MGEAMRTHGGLDLRSQAGTTLIETMIACGILIVVVAGLLSMITVATSHTENQGHLVSSTTGYAQDKMEQLLTLDYNDARIAVGGSSDPAMPVEEYVDYLDQGGALLPFAGITAPEGWFYMRVWEISDTHVPPVDKLKQITVTAIVRSSVGGAMLSRSTMAALKTSFPP